MVSPFPGPRSLPRLRTVRNVITLVGVLAVPALLAVGSAALRAGPPAADEKLPEMSTRSMPDMTPSLTERELVKFDDGGRESEVLPARPDTLAGTTRTQPSVRFAKEGPYDGPTMAERAKLRSAAECPAVSPGSHAANPQLKISPVTTVVAVPRPPGDGGLTREEREKRGGDRR